MMGKVDQKYKLYLQDLGALILERALEAKDVRVTLDKDSVSYFYESGRLMAFNEVVSILQQQAEGFGISLNELGVAGIDTDKDLV